MKHRTRRSSRGTSFNHEKYRARGWKQEHDAGGFRCSHCRQFVVINDIKGTSNRNHCSICLWSKHVDIQKGDRQATCHGGMQPVGITFKHEGVGRTGEAMLIHVCSVCEKISINRLARDDLDDKVLEILTESFALDAALYERITRNGIYVLTAADEHELRMQLFGG
jgi:hypothetical protein